jgi:hypothetical protein
VGSRLGEEQVIGFSMGLSPGSRALKRGKFARCCYAPRNGQVDETGNDGPLVLLEPKCEGDGSSNMLQASAEKLAL